MTKTFIVAALLVPTLVGAQQAPYRDSGIKSQIDWAISTEPGTAVIAGWAFNCTTQGQQPFSLRVFYLSQTYLSVYGWAVIDSRQSALLRRDVAAAFTQCGGPLNPYTGFQVRVSGIPPGRYRLTLEWADSRTAHYLDVLVDIQ